MAGDGGVDAVFLLPDSMDLGERLDLMKKVIELGMRSRLGGPVLGPHRLFVHGSDQGVFAIADIVGLPPDYVSFSPICEYCLERAGDSEHTGVTATGAALNAYLCAPCTQAGMVGSVLRNRERTGRYWL